MTDAVQEFLDQIGPRPLTADENRQLHLLRLKQGAPGNSGVADKIIADDEKK